MVENEFRAKPIGEEETECVAIGRFLFDWEAVAGTMSLTLSKSILRPFMQVVSELLEEDDEGIPVNISLSLQLYYNNMTLDKNSSTSFQLVQTVNVTNNLEGWMELDITAIISSVWSPLYKQSPIIEVALKTEVDCILHKKIPIEFVNPAEVELGDTILRAQCIDQQPLLLVYFDDPTLKQVLKMQENLLKVQKEIYNHDNNMMNEEMPSLRNKRQYDRCKKINYTVNFYDIYVNSIILPTSINMKKCIGKCDPYHSLVVNITFHSYMLAVAKNLYDFEAFQRPNSAMYSETHSFPCCSALAYRSIYATLRLRSGYKTQIIQNAIVTDCGCR